MLEHVKQLLKKFIQNKTPRHRLDGSKVSWFHNNDTNVPECLFDGKQSVPCAYCCRKYHDEKSEFMKEHSDMNGYENSDQCETNI